MEAEELVKLAASAAADKKADEIVILQVGKVHTLTDYFLICSGKTDRQVEAITENVTQKLRENGVRPLRIEGQKEGHWILLDYGSIVIHIFRDEERNFYQLERLWKDVPQLKVEVEGAEEALGSA